MQAYGQATVGLAKAERIALAIEREIRTGYMSCGDQLDSESALMRRFEVSRNTIRRGLGMLAQRGLIKTRTGIGSFVTYQGVTIDHGAGWSTSLALAPQSLTTRLLVLRRGGCSSADAFLSARDLAAPDGYLCIDRVRVCQVSGIGVSLERSRLIWRNDFDAVLSGGLKDGLIDGTLATLGLAATSGEEVAGVMAVLSDADASAMARAAGTPMLRLQRLTHAKDGSLLEQVESILDPDRFALRMTF